MEPADSSHGYYRDTGWRFATQGPAEAAENRALLPEELRGARSGLTKAEWLAKGTTVRTRNPDGTYGEISTSMVLDFPDDAKIVLRRDVYLHPNADPEYPQH